MKLIYREKEYSKNGIKKLFKMMPFTLTYSPNIKNNHELLTRIEISNFIKFFGIYLLNLRLLQNGNKIRSEELAQLINQRNVEGKISQDRPKKKLINNIK